MIGQIESEVAARRFGDFLYVQKIPNDVEPGSEGRWDIWVHDDDQLMLARQWLEAFIRHPNNAKFQVGRKAEELRTVEVQDNERFRRRMKTRGDLFQRFVSSGLGPITVLLVLICIVVFAMEKFSPHGGMKSLFGADLHYEQVHKLFFGELTMFELKPERSLVTAEIRHGEIWRLITPIFLHFGLIHILFNMMALRDLGSALESVIGSIKFTLLVLISAAISNWAEFIITGHPAFGGMSGVVYALFGFVWMKSKYQPSAGLYLHKDTVTMMLVWLVLGFTHILPIANYVHLAGLLTGVIWGFTETRLLR